MLKAGSIVHFESDNCYIRNVKSGRMTPIIEHNGTFEIGIWVPKHSPNSTGAISQESSSKSYTTADQTSCFESQCNQLEPNSEGVINFRSRVDGHILASRLQKVESQCDKRANLQTKSSPALACHNRSALLAVEGDEVDRVMPGFMWQDEQFGTNLLLICP